MSIPRHHQLPEKSLAGLLLELDRLLYLKHSNFYLGEKHSSPPAWLTCLGEADCYVEYRLILEEIRKIVKPFMDYIIVEPSARMVYINGGSPSKEEAIKALKHIEEAGRISHRSEEGITEDSWHKFIGFVVMVKGDWSIVEHINVTVDFEVDRGISHEIVRHRLASYTQESTRFINYEKKMPPRFIVPPLTKSYTHDSRCAWEEAIAQACMSYKRMLVNGESPQIARSVLPNSLATILRMTCNLRNWRHFFTMRSTVEAHPQIKEVVIPLLAQFKETIPILFADIEPNLKQSKSIAIAR